MSLVECHCLIALYIISTTVTFLYHIAIVITGLTSLYEIKLSNQDLVRDHGFYSLVFMRFVIVAIFIAKCVVSRHHALTSFVKHVYYILQIFVIGTMSKTYNLTGYNVFGYVIRHCACYMMQHGNANKLTIQLCLHISSFRIFTVCPFRPYVLVTRMYLNTF